MNIQNPFQTNPRILTDAFCFANAAHISQKRKYTNAPYIEHCVNVAKIVASVTNDMEVIAAALLHDTIEDTETTIDEIQGLSHRVAALVLEVTDVSKKSDGNRAARKEIDRQHLARSSADGATIKLADLLDNTKDILEHDKGFAAVYLKEKAALLPILAHGNSILWHAANQHLEESIKRLESNQT